MQTFEISWHKYIFPKIHNEGWKFVCIFAVLTAILAIVWAPLGCVGLAITVWCYMFFRDPERITPETKDVVVSPADGTVQMISKVAGPIELGMEGEKFTRVSVFMSVFNVHVNRAPTDGTISKIVYVAGKFLNATLDKSSDENERQLFAMTTKSGKNIAFVQIAGLVARRILCETTEGTQHKAGSRIGMIRFGSRLDVYLPEGVEPQVCLGQTMVAGESVIANLSSTAKQVKGSIR